MGRQSLVQYIEECWKGNAADVTKEYEKNKALGIKFDCWKGGVLVNDTEGRVLQALSEVKPSSSSSSTTGGGKQKVDEDVVADDDADVEAAAPPPPRGRGRGGAARG